MKCSSEILIKSTANDAETALEVIAEALMISPYSEKLLEMKTEALFTVCTLFLILRNFTFRLLKLIKSLFPVFC